MSANPFTTAMLDRVLTPFLDVCLLPEVAERLVDLRADEATQHRIDELADKSTEGMLSEAERMEYSALVAAGSLVSVLQARARKVLQQRNGSHS